MLNISENTIQGKVATSDYRSWGMIRSFAPAYTLVRVLVALLILFIIIIFLPWTQNISADGKVTTLQPDQRPQTINTVIGGQIEKWFVREGDFVKKGDTIVFIRETKDEYFDPNLLTNTEQQIKSKELSVTSYMEKVKSLDAQIDALNQVQKLKIEQAKNYIEQSRLKVIADSIDLEAAKTNLEIAELQFNRTDTLYQQGLKSRTEWEDKKQKLQESLAKKISQESKLLSSKNALINSQVELTSIQGQYRDKLSKAESEKYASLSAMYDAEALVTKMQNQYMNYIVRTGMYFITAPQDGYVTQAISSGIGETLKPGDEVVSIMPASYQLAVAMYVKPMDLPLIDTGQHVRIIFDGWPAVVFSGWPGASLGTFGGRVVAIDRFISDNGKYRLLVMPDRKMQEIEWPEALRVGAGARAMALLNDVPLWYEVWRQLNGFPPDFYGKSEAEKEEKVKKKAPLKSVK